LNYSTTIGAVQIQLTPLLLVSSLDFGRLYW
jgi:hypothetical protein